MANASILRAYGTAGRDHPEDGAEWADLPEPEFRRVHNLGGHWARDGSYEIKISEVRYPEHAMLTVIECSDDAGWVAAEHLMAMAQLYLGSGFWAISSMSPEHVALIPRQG